MVGGRFDPVGWPEILEVLFGRDFEPSDPQAAGQIPIDKLIRLREPGLQNHGAVSCLTCHFTLAVMHRLLRHYRRDARQAI